MPAPPQSVSGRGSSRKDHLRPRLIKCFPQRLHLGGTAVLYPRAKAWVVHVGQGAPPLIISGVGGEVFFEPLPLEGAGVEGAGAAAHRLSLSAVAV